MMKISQEEFNNKLIAEGYMREDGTPLKCQHCDSKKLKDTKIIIDESRVLEYQVVCEECRREVGYWAYGYWQI